MLGSCNDEPEGLVNPSAVNTWRYFDTRNGLGSNFINTVFEDSNGNIWIGTSRGLCVFDGNDITTYSTAHGLVDNNIFSVAEDTEGNIWVGSARGLNILVNNEWLYFPYFYGAGIYALLNLNGEEGMLIGTGGYGIHRYDYKEENFSVFSFIDGCPGCNSINSLFQASDKSVWVASFSGARKIRGSFITVFDQSDGLDGSIATTIAEDSWGNIWIGTVEGATIAKVSGNMVTPVAFNNGADQNFIFGIQEARDGNLWVGTVGNGLFHYDGAIMRQLYSGPPDNTITCLLKDHKGNLWIGTSEGGLAQYITNPN